MVLTNKTYDILKWIQAICVLLATFVEDIFNIWKLPYGDQISKTFLALATILLGILKVASERYHRDLNTVRDDEPNEDIVDHEKVD